MLYTVHVRPQGGIRKSPLTIAPYAKKSLTAGLARSRKDGIFWTAPGYPQRVQKFAKDATKVEEYNINTDHWIIPAVRYGLDNNLQSQKFYHGVPERDWAREIQFRGLKPGITEFWVPLVVSLAFANIKVYSEVNLGLDKEAHPVNYTVFLNKEKVDLLLQAYLNENNLGYRPRNAFALITYSELQSQFVGKPELFYTK